MRVQAQQGIKSVVFEAKVTRADGTVEELGQISYWHRNPLKRWANKVNRWMDRH